MQQDLSSLAGKSVLVTGATGFLGSHIAEALCSLGCKVRTLARPSSDVGLLESIGVEVRRGDLLDAAAVESASRGVDMVVHSAAKVGDWGKLEDYRRINVEATEVLVKAVLGGSLERFVLISSLGVYPARDHAGTDEAAELPERHIDAYTQTKVESEMLCRSYAEKAGLPLVVLRPGFVYGPRDRTVMPRILSNLKRRLVSYFGSKHKLMNNVYVGNVVEAVLLALTKPNAVGQIYNITDGECVSKKVFFGTIAELAGLPKPLMTYPMWIARPLCGGFELMGKTFGFKPVLNNARLKFMGLNLDYSIEKAKRELGYAPSTDFATGIRKTIDWLREIGKVK